MYSMGFPGGAGVKNSPASAGDARDVDSILGREVPLEEEMATQSSILAWKIPWAEKPGGLQSTGVTKSRTQLSACTHTLAVWHRELYSASCNKP